MIAGTYSILHRVKNWDLMSDFHLTPVQSAYNTQLQLCTIVLLLTTAGRERALYFCKIPCTDICSFKMKILLSPYVDLKSGSRTQSLGFALASSALIAFCVALRSQHSHLNQ